MRTADEIRALLHATLASTSADEAEVRYSDLRELGTRFGDNAITQNIATARESVTVDVYFGRQKGTVETLDLSRDGLAAAVARAEGVARAVPEDPELVPLPGPQVYGARPPSYFADVAELAPEQVASDVAQVVAAARAAGFVASGYFEAVAAVEAVANSKGLFGHQAHTDLRYGTTLHGPAGSGKAAANTSARAEMDVADLVQTAVANARLAQSPTAIEPGDYTVIFEPLAAAQLLAFLVFGMSAREAAEGATPFSGQVGQRLLSEKVTVGLVTDDVTLPAPVFGEAGLAVEPRSWVRNGVVTRLRHDRYWAAETGESPDPSLAPLCMAGEDRSAEELVSACPRGLLVKNLWYIRFVDQKTLLLTGMTRDGVFLVEDGQVVRSVKNLRWNESPVVFMQNVLALSHPERVAGWLPLQAPAVMSADFTFTSVTDSV